MADISARQIRELESLVTEWMNKNEVPGASVVVVDEDGEQYAEGFGARDIETNAPATPDTLYGMGSISKSVTALAIIQLAEAGQLSIGDSVNEYVDHYRDAPGDPITIRELLTHTSGMPANPTGVFEQALSGFPTGIADETDRKRFVQDSTSFRETEEDRFFYYNTGYDMLGEVLEAAAGQPYTAYVQDEIFEPLNMDRSTFDADRLADVDDAMTGYQPGGDEDPPEPKQFPLGVLERPSGGLISSARELARFLRAMMTDGSLDETRVCSPDAVRQLQQERVTFKRFVDGTEQRYGFGWTRQPLAGDEVIGHGGSVLVSSSYAGYLRDAGLGIVVACNTSADPHPSAVGKALLALLNDQDVTAVPAYALKEKCERVTGTYEAYRGELTITVERDGGGLEISFEGRLVGDESVAFPASLDPSDYEFYTITRAGTRERLEFDFDGDQDDLYFQRHRARRVNNS